MLARLSERPRAKRFAGERPRLFHAVIWTSARIGMRETNMNKRSQISVEGPLEQGGGAGIPPGVNVTLMTLNVT
jgi:hypothetical protein